MIDLLASFTSECPSWLAAEERAFIDDRLEETVRRIPGPKTPEEFEELIDFGEPIIITDAMKGTYKKTVGLIKLYWLYTKNRLNYKFKISLNSCNFHKQD